jgi:toxin ParE1/3/4
VAYSIAFRPAATADLKRIYLYIAEEAGRERAGAYIDRIEAACMGLASFPERGTVRKHILPGVRIIGFERSASIAFTVENDTVTILRVLARGMDLPADWLE